MCLLSTPCGIVAATDMGIASAKSARCGDCIGVGYSAMSPDFSFSTGSAGNETRSCGSRTGRPCGARPVSRRLGDWTKLTLAVLHRCRNVSLKCLFRIEISLKPVSL